MRLLQSRLPYLPAMMLIAAACGNPDGNAGSMAEPVASASADQKPAANKSSSTLDPAGFINAFSLRTDGTVEETWKGDTLHLSGGCTPGAPLSIGFRSGTPVSENYLYVGFDTEKSIGPGETGTFRLKEIRWDRGTARNDRGARVPQRYSGTGTLVLSTHRAKVGDQRLSGTLKGEKLTRPGAPPVDLVIEFDINRSCGITG